MYPRSEHERHTGGCPYIRGEYTENVPSSTTEASHPAVYCSGKGDSVVCISSTSTGTGLMAVGTEHGHISIWELDRGLLIMVCCSSMMCRMLIAASILHSKTMDSLPTIMTPVDSMITISRDGLCLAF